MEISEALYNWLRASNIIPAPSKLNKTNQIPDLDLESFEYGCQFSQVLSRTISLLQKTEQKILLKNLLDGLKAYKTNSSKKANWSIIKSVLHELGIKADSDDIELIKAGSGEALERLLEQIFEYEQNVFSQSDSETTPKNMKSPERYRSGELVIEAITGTIPLLSTRSCLEFLLVSFCKHFSLHPKQAAGLLTQSGKYLAYICSRGFKGKHEFVGIWLADIHKHSNHLAQLILNESPQGGLTLILTSLSHSLNSRNLENVLKSCKIFTALLTELQDLNSESKVEESLWTWFTSTGLEACLLGLKRFGAYIKREVVIVFCAFAKGNYWELFTTNIPELIPEIIQYLAFIHELLESFLMSQYREKIIQEGVLDFLIDLALEQAENLSVQPDERMTAINIICEIWANTQVIDNNETYSARIVKTFEKISREKSVLLKISCLGRFFVLLEHFAESRSFYAPVIYKIITFALVENYSEIETKEFIVNNFVALFRRIEVPLKILLEPLAKHLTISSVTDFNLADFYFFDRIAESSQLNPKLGLLFVDSLAKLLVEHEFYGRVIGGIILKIVKIFIEVEMFQEYLVRFLRVYIKIVEKSESWKQGKNSALMWVVENCLEINMSSVNEPTETVICQMLVENSVPGMNVWLTSLLEICGDALEIIEKYKKLVKPEPKSNGTTKKTENLPSTVLESQKTAEKQRVISQKKTMRKQVETKKLEDSEDVNITEVKSPTRKPLDQFPSEDLALIKVSLKSKKSVFREVFKVYSTKRKLQRIETFEHLNESVNSVADSDIYKLLKKVVEPALMLNLSQFVEFSKEFCQLFQRPKSYFEFSDFQFFLAYISCQIFTKPPTDYSLHPPIYSVLLLISLLEKGFPSKKSVSQQIDPDQDPPAGYKKLKIKDVQVQYKPPSSLSLPLTHEIAVNILDELLYSLFSFHFLEPQVCVVDVFKIQQDFVNIHGKSVSVSINTNTPRKIVNKFEAKKLQEKIEMIKEKKMKEKKRILRVQLVKSQISKIGNVTQKKIEVKKKVEIDEEKRQMLIKRLEAKIEKDRLARIEEIAKWKNKKEEELRIKGEIEKEKLNRDRELRIKRREEFFENEKIRLQKLSMDIAESKKIIPKIEAEKEIIEKKLREKKIEKHKTTLEIHRKTKEQTELEEKALFEDFTSESIQTIIKAYDRPLQLIFSHFCNSKHLPNNEEKVLQTSMTFSDFYRFSKQFKITPEIIPKEDCKKMFILVMKSNENFSINFEAFKFLCFRISKLLKTESSSSEDILRDFISHMELPKDINITRNVLRRQETLKSTKN